MTTKYPPRLSFLEAVEVIKRMYADHQSREIATDLMPEILATKQTSSFFIDKVNALLRFGLVDKMPNDLLYLTDLAMQIIKPIGNEDSEARLQSFRKNSVLADLLAKYPNGKLPSSDQLQQSLLKSYQVPRDRVKNWYDFILDSFKGVADIIGGPPGPNLSLSGRARTSSPTPQSDIAELAKGTSNFQFSIPINESDSIKVTIPRSATTKELKILMAMIQALGTPEKN